MSSSSPATDLISSSNCIQQRETQHHHHHHHHHGDLLGHSYPMTRSHHYDPLGLASTYSHGPRPVDPYQTQYSTSASSTGMLPFVNYVSYGENVYRERRLRRKSYM